MKKWLLIYIIVVGLYLLIVITGILKYNSDFAIFVNYSIIIFTILILTIVGAIKTNSKK